jgi:methionyl-tRNA formyltransferase
MDAQGTAVKDVLLLGMGPTTVTALESLVQRFSVVGLVRDMRGGPEDEEVASRAAECSVPLYSDIRPDAVDALLARTRPDCTVMSSYNRILPPAVLGRTPFVNVHYAPLPRYRGRANVNWALINGEPEAAITIHAVEAGLDAGNILFQEAVALGPDDTVSLVYERLNSIQRRELGRTVERFLDGFTGEPQNEAQSTYGCTRVEADGEIPWDSPTKDIYALVRALAHPYPPAHTYLDCCRIAIVSAAPSPSARQFVGRVAGRVVERSPSRGYVDVLTGDGTLRVFEVMVPGEAHPVAASTVITSTTHTLGLRAADLLARIEELERRLRRANPPGE